jgi:hypothetical protein
MSISEHWRPQRGNKRKFAGVQCRSSCGRYGTDTRD